MTHISIDRPIKIVFIVLTAANWFFMISIMSSFFSFLSMTSPVAAKTFPRPHGSAIYADAFTVFSAELVEYWNSDNF